MGENWGGVLELERERRGEREGKGEPGGEGELELDLGLQQQFSDEESKRRGNKGNVMPERKMKEERGEVVHLSLFPASPQTSSSISVSFASVVAFFGP